MKKRSDIIRIILILLLTACLMLISSVVIYNVIKPEFYSQFMTEGSKYLAEGNYEYSIMSYSKAIKIEKDSTAARVGIAKGSIGVGDGETAVKVLKAAQQIDIQNVELLKEMIDVLKEYEPNAAYEILMTYVNNTGENNIGADIKELAEEAHQMPQIPQIIPQSGTYIKPFDLELSYDKIRVGHAVYYTLDGSEPTIQSTQYKSGIKVDGNVNIKMRGYNVDGTATEIFEACYVIDTDAAENIKTAVETAENERDLVSEGTEVGTCAVGAKDELNAALAVIEQALSKDIISLEEAESIYISVQTATDNFKQKIITPTDKTALEAEINKAKTFVENTEEINDTKIALSDAITEASEVYNDVTSKQETVDKAKDKLSDEIKSFEAKKN